MKSTQEADQDLQIVKDWLENGRPDSKLVEGHDYYLKSLYSQFDRLCLVNGIVCRKWEDLDTGTNRYQAVVPENRRRMILHYCHDEKKVGHLGIKKTLEKVRQSYYWPKLQIDVRQYVVGCQFCAKCKGENRSRTAPMKVVETGYPME